MVPSRRRVAMLLTVVPLAAALAACAAAPVPTGDDDITVVDDAEQANLVLYVSNQSFEHDRVDITVRIDGVLVVDQSFAVEGQHNWLEFPIKLPAGEHTLEAISGTGVGLSEPVTVPDGEKRWVVLDYWYYPDRGDGSDVVDPSLTLTVHEEQVGFD
jgi:hypothetical protein